MRVRLSHFKSFVFAAAAVVMLSVSAGAITVDDYQERIETVRLDVIALRRLEDEGSRFDQLKVQKVDEVRRSLPALENRRIAIQGTLQ